MMHCWILALLWLFYVARTAVSQKEQKGAPPMITNFLSYDLLNPDQVKFRVQNALVLPCGASGTNLKWSWYHNDTKIPEGALTYGNKRLGRDGTLTGSSLGSADSGTYQCFVEDTVSGVKTFSRKIRVAVTVIGEFADQTPVEELVDLGLPFSFACPAHGQSYGASYSWEGRNMIQFNRNQRRGITPSSGKLFIAFVTQEDIDEIATLGGIRCTVSAANTFYSSGVLTLKKRIPDQSDPQTLKPPTWEVLPGSTVIALERRNKTLYCFATGRPAPTITWKKDGKQIQSGKESFEIPNAFQGRLLIIITVQKNIHEGRYTCEAENSENAGNAIKHNINLRVEVSPRWTSGRPPESKMTIGNASNKTLACDVTAIPAPSFSWFRDGQRISASTNRVKLDNNNLHFLSITFDEDGLYQCVAENVHGMIVSSTWVHVVVTWQNVRLPSSNESNIATVGHNSLSLGEQCSHIHSHHPNNMSLVAVGVFQFAEATVRVPESSPEVEITIENKGDTNVSARLRLSLKESSATSGKDFLLSDQPAIVRFSPDNASQKYRVKILDDAERETDESFKLEMSFSGPASPAVTLGSPSVITVIIEDDDAPTESPSGPLRAASGNVPNVTVNMEANITVVCLPDYIEVTLLKANFPGIVVNDTVLHLNDMSCGAGYKDDDMVKFTFGLESCGTMMSSNSEKIYYMNKVYLTADPPTDNSDITRYHTEVIPFSCGYDKKATISKISYSPKSTLVVTDAAGFGNFTYEMTMYTDETNQEEVTQYPFEVGLGLPMYLGFSVVSGDAKLDVFPDVCKATAGSGFESTPDHLIIQNACPRDDTLKYDYQQGAKHYFSVAAFRFTQGYDDVYIHCKLTACRRVDSDSRCAKGCQESRRRRSLKDYDLSATVRIGPLSLKNKNQRDVALDEKSNVAAASSSSGMVMVVGVLVGVLGTVAIALVVAVVIISRRRKYATVDKGDLLVVADEI